jgi:hypothetical protein
VKIYEYDYPGRQIHLESSSIDFSPAKITELAVEGLQTFCSNFIAPLALDLSLNSCDPEFLLPQTTNPSFYYLRLQDFPPQVEQKPAWQDASVETISAINQESITNWISRLIDEKTNQGDSPNNSSIIFWQEIFIGATQICLPRSMDISENNLTIQRGSHAISYPIQKINDRIYASGPIISKSTTAPIELKVTTEAGFLSLDINVLWTLWANSELEGIVQLTDGLERLRSLGWVCTYSEVEGLNT